VGEFLRLVAATLLGALISFGTTYYFERRKERATQMVTMRQDQRKLQLAARLVRDELQANGAILFSAADDNQWWSYPPHDVSQRLWLEYQATLAALVGQKTWDTLSLTYSFQTQFNVSLSMAREGKEGYGLHTTEKHVLEPITDLVMTEAWRMEVEGLVQEIGRADDALGSVTSTDGQGRESNPLRQGQGG
jgi:hypothetical protein